MDAPLIAECPKAQRGTIDAALKQAEWWRQHLVGTQNALDRRTRPQDANDRPKDGPGSLLASPTSQTFCVAVIKCPDNEPRYLFTHSKFEEVDVPTEIRNVVAHMKGLERTELLPVIAYDRDARRHLLVDRLDKLGQQESMKSDGSASWIKANNHVNRLEKDSQYKVKYGIRRYDIDDENDHHAEMRLSRYMADHPDCQVFYIGPTKYYCKMCESVLEKHKWGNAMPDGLRNRLISRPNDFMTRMRTFSVLGARYTVHATIGDGNCFFHALSGMGVMEGDGPAIRAEVINRLQTRITDGTDNDPAAAAVTRLRKPMSYVDIQDLPVIGDVLGRHFYVREQALAGHSVQERLYGDTNKPMVVLNLIYGPDGCGHFEQTSPVI